MKKIVWHIASGQTKIIIGYGRDANDALKRISSAERALIRNKAKSCVTYDSYGFNSSYPL